MQLRIFILFSFLFTVLSVPVFAQSTPVIDSLLQQNALITTKDTAKINLLLQIALPYATVNPPEGIRYADEAMQLATSITTNI
jgi:hypothetical protein